MRVSQSIQSFIRWSVFIIIHWFNHFNIGLNCCGFGSRMMVYLCYYRWKPYDRLSIDMIPNSCACNVQMCSSFCFTNNSSRNRKCGFKDWQCCRIPHAPAMWSAGQILPTSFWRLIFFHIFNKWYQNWKCCNSQPCGQFKFNLEQNTLSKRPLISKKVGSSRRNRARKPLNTPLTYAPPPKQNGDE